MIYLRHFSFTNKASKCHYRCHTKACVIGLVITVFYHTMRVSLWHATILTSTFLTILNLLDAKEYTIFELILVNFSEESIRSCISFIWNSQSFFAWLADNSRISNAPINMNEILRFSNCSSIFEAQSRYTRSMKDNRIDNRKYPRN